MKKEHLKKVSIVILKSMFFIYWETVRNLSVNAAFDFVSLFSKLSDVIKLVLLILISIITVPLIVVFSPVALPVFSLWKLKKELKTFSVFYENGYLPRLKEIGKTVIPIRKKHQRYCIEDGFITEYFLNKNGKSERSIIEDVNPLIGDINQFRITKNHAIHLITKTESLKKIVAQK